MLDYEALADLIPKKGLRVGPRRLRGRAGQGLGALRVHAPRARDGLRHAAHRRLDGAGAARDRPGDGAHRPRLPDRGDGPQRRQHLRDLARALRGGGAHARQGGRPRQHAQRPQAARHQHRGDLQHGLRRRARDLHQAPRLRAPERRVPQGDRARSKRCSTSTWSPCPTSPRGALMSASQRTLSARRPHPAPPLRRDGRRRDGGAARRRGGRGAPSCRAPSASPGRPSRSDLAALRAAVAARLAPVRRRPRRRASTPTARSTRAGRRSTTGSPASPSCPAATRRARRPRPARCSRSSTPTGSPSSCSPTSSSGTSPISASTRIAAESLGERIARARRPGVHRGAVEGAHAGYGKLLGLPRPARPEDRGAPPRRGARGLRLDAAASTRSR